MSARARDEHLLDMVRRRAGGASTGRIAAQLGVSQQHVTAATNGVMRADIAESGEDAARVAAAYWPVAGRRSVRA